MQFAHKLAIAKESYASVAEHQTKTMFKMFFRSHWGEKETAQAIDTFVSAMLPRQRN